MNRTLGKISALTVAGAVLFFAVTMLVNWLPGSYAGSMLIAWSYVLLAATFAHYAPEARKTAGFAGLAFAAMYALCNSFVYYIQLATVIRGGLTAQAASLLDFQQYGMIFSLDMLGYALMSVSTFFLGLTLCPVTKVDRWLKGLLMVHGIFAPSCLVVPLLGLFDTAMPDSSLIGTLVLEFWCAYFIPLCVLAYVHMSRKTESSKQ